MKIVFKEEGKEAELVEGRSILSYVQALGIDLNASCGGEGKCGQCMVEVECADSALSGKTGAEKKFIPEDKKRLACQTRILRTDEHIYVCVPKRTYYVLESGEYKEIALEPFIHVEGERVFCQSEDLGEYTGEIYGIALDIGTTTLSMYLIDLENGKVHSVISRENPQTKYGNNVISRIEFARNGQSTLESEIRTTVNSMITTLTNDAGSVYEMVVVGNPVMRDLFFGHSVESLGKSPYEPQGVTPITKLAARLGLVINPKARVYGLPLIGSFVGADTLAVVLATEMYKGEKICLAIDIGTNTEIVLGNRDRLIATSCAAGPAFEGAGVTCGIGGVSGAIKEVSKNGDVRYKTIDDAAPVGICGSGLIDTLAELLDKKIIDGRGKFYGAEKEFAIAEGISISERDIDQLNLAKTAVSVGVRVLLERYGLTLEDIDCVFLAGGFVNFTNTEHAIRIGLLPAVERKKVKKVGNAAVEGARQVLISKTKREDAEAVAARIEHVKLENEANFMELFVSELYFQAYL